MSANHSEAQTPASDPGDDLLEGDFEAVDPSGDLEPVQTASAEAMPSKAGGGLRSWMCTGGLLLALPVVTVGGLAAAHYVADWMGEETLLPEATIQQVPAVERTPQASPEQQEKTQEPLQVADAGDASESDAAELPSDTGPSQAQVAAAEDASSEQAIESGAAADPSATETQLAQGEANPSEQQDASAEQGSDDALAAAPVEPASALSPDPAPVSAYETLAEQAYAWGMTEPGAADESFEEFATSARELATEPVKVEAARHSALWWARQAMAQAQALEPLHPGRAAEAYTRIAEVAGRQTAAFDARAAVARLRAMDAATAEQLKRGIGALAAAGDHWGVKDALDAIERPRVKASALAAVMLAHARNGDPDAYQRSRDELEAYLIDQQGDEAAAHDGWLAHVSAHLQLGDADTAAQLAERAPESLPWPTRSRALSRVAAHLASQGEADASLKLLERVTHQPTSDDARRETVGALAAAGEIEAAEQLADRIADPARRADAWVALARVKLAENQREAYRRYADQALATVRHDFAAYRKVLTDVTEAEAQADYFFSAASRLREVDFLASRMAPAEAVAWRDQIVGTLAIERSRQGRHLHAMRLARQVQTPERYDQVLSSIAQHQADLGLLDAAQAKADALYSEPLREQVLGRIAANMAGSDRPADAVAWLQHFEATGQLSAMLAAAQTLSLSGDGELVRGE